MTVNQILDWLVAPTAPKLYISKEVLLSCGHPFDDNPLNYFCIAAFIGIQICIAYQIYLWLNPCNPLAYSQFHTLLVQNGYSERKCLNLYSQYLSGNLQHSEKVMNALNAQPAAPTLPPILEAASADYTLLFIALGIITCIGCYYLYHWYFADAPTGLTPSIPTNKEYVEHSVNHKADWIEVLQPGMLEPGVLTKLLYLYLIILLLVFIGTMDYALVARVAMCLSIVLLIIASYDLIHTPDNSIPEILVDLSEFQYFYPSIALVSLILLQILASRVKHGPFKRAPTHSNPDCRGNK